MCILNSFITGAQTAIWLHILKNYISKVIYHSLKSYTSFERTYNKLSKKNLAVWKPIILHWKKLQDTFSYYLCKNSNIKCDFSKIILGLKEIFFSSYLAKQTTNQLKILNDTELFINFLLLVPIIEISMQIRVLA